MPPEAFPPELELSEGDLVSFTDDQGEEILGLIKAMGEEAIQVDFNHPLAGHTIFFDVEVLDVIPAESFSGNSE
jgi:FKBP-type peptidyl-prolyl cis-trans isomerase SlpA